jgi:hypothetical protein
MKKENKRKILDIEKKELIQIIVGASIFMLLSYFFKELPLVILMLFFGIIIFLFSFHSKFRVILQLSSLFIFLHLIIFPSIYLLILRYDSNSFEFDNYIAKTEKNSSLNKIKKEFEPEQLISKLNIINSILKSNSLKLDTTLVYLNKKNIISIDSLKIFVSSSYLDKDEVVDLPDDRSNIDFTICNFNGQFIDKISETGYSFLERENRTIKQFLDENKSLLSNDLVSYKEIKKGIELDNKFWSYSKILPYCINIFDTGNINPKAPLSNVIFFIHKFLVWGFIVSIIVSLLPNYFEKSKQNTIKNRN